MGKAKSGARKSARKSARKNADAAAAQGDSLLQEKGSEARKRAGMDEAVGGNILGSEPLGPSAEHEDHEGGLTDSLSKKGVRGPIPTAEEREESDEDEQVQVVRAPSVRERQLRRARGGAARPDAVSALKALNEEEDGELVRVVATGEGFYGNKRRHRGDVFDYRMGPDEEKLPMWVTSADGSVESRRKGEVPAGSQTSTFIEVHPTGGVSVREGQRSTTTAPARKSASKSTEK